MPRILLVDDEEALRASLSYALRREGYDVATAADGLAALEQAEAFQPDVVLLDVMLPGMDGMEVCRRLRARGDTAIILLTAKDGSADKVAGLETGADDYVVKPFNTRELLARIAAVLRRHEQARRLLHQDRVLVARLEQLVRNAEHAPVGAGAAGTVLTVDDVRLDVDAGEALVRGRSVDLEASEFQLLRLLMSSRGRVVTRTELIQGVWGKNSRDGLAVLDARVRTLMEKVEEDPLHPRHILAVPGIGYIFQ